MKNTIFNQPLGTQYSTLLMPVLPVFNGMENNVFTLDAINIVDEHYREEICREKSFQDAVRLQR